MDKPEWWEEEKARMEILYLIAVKDRFPTHKEAKHYFDKSYDVVWETNDYESSDEGVLRLLLNCTDTIIRIESFKAEWDKRTDEQFD
jgi:hypothetical protein